MELQTGQRFAQRWTWFCLWATCPLRWWRRWWGWRFQTAGCQRLSLPIWSNFLSDSWTWAWFFFFVKAILPQTSVTAFFRTWCISDLLHTGEKYGNPICHYSLPRNICSSYRQFLKPHVQNPWQPHTLGYSLIGKTISTAINAEGVFFRGFSWYESQPLWERSSWHLWGALVLYVVTPFSEIFDKGWNAMKCSGGLL